MADRYRNDQAYQAQFGQALAYDVNQRHEKAVFASQSVQDDQGLQRQASEVLGAQAGVPPGGGGQPGVGQQVSISEPDLVGMLRRNQQAADFIGNKVFELGLQGEARRKEWLTRELYPDAVGRELAADVRTLLTSPSLGDTQRAMISAELGDLLKLSQVPDLGDAEQHAGIGPGMDSMGRSRARWPGRTRSARGIQAGTTGKLDQSQQEVDAGQNHVAQRSAANNAGVQHHQDINKVDAQLQREATDEAAKDAGRDANLATEAQAVHKGVQNWVKDILEWVTDKINGLAPWEWRVC